MQILSNSAVATGAGVYWMFYAGASREDVQVPQGLPGLQCDTKELEGLRSVFFFAVVVYVSVVMLLPAEKTFTHRKACQDCSATLKSLKV